LVTRQEAQEMRDAIRQLEAAEQAAEQAARQILIDQALAWWDTIKPAIPTTRAEALAVVRFIEGLQRTETDNFRLQLLRNKLQQALIKLQERKRNV